MLPGDRRVISGIVHVIRSWLRWRSAPDVYGPIRRCKQVHSLVPNDTLPGNDMQFQRLLHQNTNRGGKPPPNERPDAPRRRLTPLVETSPAGLHDRSMASAPDVQKRSGSATDRVRSRSFGIAEALTCHVIFSPPCEKPPNLMQRLGPATGCRRSPDRGGQRVDEIRTAGAPE